MHLSENIISDDDSEVVGGERSPSLNIEVNKTQQSQPDFDNDETASATQPASDESASAAESASEEEGSLIAEEEDSSQSDRESEPRPINQALDSESSVKRDAPPQQEPDQPTSPVSTQTELPSTDIKDTPALSRNPLSKKTPGKTMGLSQAFGNTQAPTSVFRPQVSPTALELQSERERPSPKH